MSCSTPTVIGETCDDQINYGETIDLLFTYEDENGTAIDLTSATATVESSTPDVIKEEAVLTVTDAANGKLRFLLHRDYAGDLRRGRNNFFRIKVVFGDDSDDITPDIYLQVT